MLCLDYLPAKSPLGKGGSAKLVLGNEIEELGRLPHFVEELSRKIDLGSDVVYNLNLALEEALSNIIMYAYPEQQGMTIEVEALWSDELLTITITDGGVPFDPTTTPEADITLSAEERPIGGLGIFLIRQIMDAVEYHRADEKNILTLKKRL